MFPAPVELKALNDPGPWRPLGDLFGSGSGEANREGAEIGSEGVGAVDEDFSPEGSRRLQDLLRGLPGSCQHDDVSGSCRIGNAGNLGSFPG